ncbi:MAG: hypothetical protein WC455_15800 [Dehalococcoidia bacterium]|jgi:hypothetical protein
MTTPKVIVNIKTGQPSKRQQEAWYKFLDMVQEWAEKLLEAKQEAAK